MGRREEKKELTRHQLLDAALALIARQDFEQTTVNEIAAAAHVSARTFLRYFPTKEDVIVAWVSEAMAVLPNSLMTRPVEEPARDALLTAARKTLGSYEERAEFFLVLERIIAMSPPISARKQHMIECLIRKVSTALTARGHWEKERVVLSDVYAGVVVSMVQAAIREWIAMNGRKSLLALFDETCCAITYVDLKI